MTQTEAELQEQVAQYLRLQYPDVLFHSDFGSGVKLTPSQAVRQKKQNGGRRAWPDLFIAQPVHKNKALAATMGVHLYGLFLELKREGARLEKKNGEWASPHIAEQAEVLAQLQNAGYYTAFACGFDEAKKVIDDYLGGEE